VNVVAASLCAQISINTMLEKGNLTKDWLKPVSRLLKGTGCEITIAEHH
jgi:hypothetical protein